jgi:hypothetical protein
MSKIITTDELKLATGFESNSAIERCLRKQKIPLLHGKGGAVFTTLDAINSALGLSTGSLEENLNIEFFK